MPATASQTNSAGNPATEDGSVHRSRLGASVAGEVRERATWLVPAIAAAITLVHLLTNRNYGFHRDELQFLMDARHLDWGFVVYPPVTPLIGKLSLTLFGGSLVGLRLFADLAQAAAILATGLMARELGGRRLAQTAAALAVALAPSSLHYGTQFIYSSFDYLWWVLTAYFIIRLLRSDTPRWWLAIGATLGIGLMTKYTIGAYIVGILAGLLFTSARRYLRNAWFWAGVTIALLICLPNVLWQFHHNFISLHWMHAIHIRDLGIGRANGFVAGQFVLDNNLIATPLWITGLLCCFLRPAFRRYRPLAWMYLVPFALLFAAKSRFYYPAPAYPMLLAIGACYAEIWLTRSRSRSRLAIEFSYFTLLTAYALLAAASTLPIAASGPLYRFAMKNNEDFREEVGWQDLTREVAQVRATLPPDTPQHTVGILVGNYGETGALELYGPALHLPEPISGANSAWLRGYTEPAPTTLIVLGLTRSTADGWFPNCRVARLVTNSQGIQNLEDDPIRSTILICGAPRQPWPVFWKQFKSFG